HRAGLPDPPATDRRPCQAPRGAPRPPALPRPAAVLRADPHRRLHRRLGWRAEELWAQPRLRLRRASPRRLAREVMRMQFGWLTLGLSPSSDGDYTAIHEQVAQAFFAETAGFDGIWLTEHNFTGEIVYFDPIPFVSLVAGRTARLR